MLEGRRPVVLHEKMGNPRQRVRNEQCQRNPPPVPQRNGRDQQSPSRQRSCQVNRARARVAVRPHVLRPKICEILLAAHAAESITSSFAQSAPFFFTGLFPGKNASKLHFPDGLSKIQRASAMRVCGVRIQSRLFPISHSRILSCTDPASLCLFAGAGKRCPFFVAQD
jgi:hypothetical protein